MSVFAGVGCALLGALLGPLLASLTVRVPAGDPLFTKGAWRGAWRGEPAGPRRRVVLVVLAALVLGAVGAGVGWAAPLPAYLWFGAVGVALGVIDVDCQRLPDRLTLPCYPVGLVLLAAASLARHDFAPLLRAVLAAAALFSVFFILAFISPASLGFGDVKLSGVLGLYLGWLGWGVLAVGMITGFLVGAVVAIGLLVGRRAGWSSDVAFGPSLLAGALFAVVAGQRLVDAYLTAMGLPPTT